MEGATSAAAASGSTGAAGAGAAPPGLMSTGAGGAGERPAHEGVAAAATLQGSGGGTGPLAGVPHTQPGVSAGHCAGAAGAGAAAAGTTVGSEVTEVGRGSGGDVHSALFSASTKLSEGSSSEVRSEGEPESAPDMHEKVSWKSSERAEGVAGDSGPMDSSSSKESEGEEVREGLAVEAGAGLVAAMAVHGGSGRAPPWWNGSTIGRVATGAGAMPAIGTGLRRGPAALSIICRVGRGVEGGTGEGRMC